MIRGVVRGWLGAWLEVRLGAWLGGAIKRGWK